MGAETNVSVVGQAKLSKAHALLVVACIDFKITSLVRAAKACAPGRLREAIELDIVELQTIRSGF